ncbi:MAG TPA: hypothetical protein VKY36_03470 [Moheibacter sp.]|nr:hypothetical protein [Moheibacter sp.]
MKKQFSMTNLPYVPKIWATLVYFLLFIIVFVLFLGRTVEGLQIPILMEKFPGFYSHISNFSISFMVCLVAGYMGILASKKLTSAFIFGALLILANFVYEWFVPFLNTPDKMDAYYGFVGTLMPFPYFYFYQKFGLKPNPKFKSK